MYEKKIYDMSMDEFFKAFRPQFEKIISQAIKKTITETDKRDLRDREVTVNELVKMRVVGARTRILSLIRKGHIELTPSGKVQYKSVLNYLESKDEIKNV